MGELAKRVIVALIAAPLALAMVWWGELPLALFMGAVAGVGAWELYRIARAGGIDALDALGIPVAVGIPIVVHLDRLQLLRAPEAVGGVIFVALLGASIWARGVAGRPLAAVAAATLMSLDT